MAALQATPVIEPPVIETITAWTYRVVGEYVWIARIYSSLFWVLAGIFLFLLAREMTSNEGGVIALLFYLFLPYGVIASRSFQPDPLMTALIVAALWALYRWHSSRGWKWAITAGLLMGAAIFVKNVAVFMLGPAAVVLVLQYGRENGWRKSLANRQTWAVALLAVLPVIAFTVYGVWSGFLTSQFAFRFFPELWSTGAFYLRWLGQVDGIVGLGACSIAVVGVFLGGRRNMAFLASLWLGYVLLGMTFSYHIITHDYYSLALIPVVALSLAPAAQALVKRAQELQLGSLPQAALLVLVLFAVALQLWNVRVTLDRDDWRPDAVFWKNLGDKLGHDPHNIVAGIAQDYGYRLEYWGWQNVESWYYSSDLELRALDNRVIDTNQRLQDRLVGRRFFVVTQSKIFTAQPDVKAYITKHYPVYARGKGYVIFDLTHPLIVTQP
jgi:4-amino-4-deoxy-L-arabinose transferase-like glycosyltransferase